MMKQIKLLLVDDHAVVRAGYRQLISTTDDITIVGESSTAEDACQKYIELKPDVVIMDLSLPSMTGLEAIRRITLHNEDSVAVLAFSIHNEAIYVQRAIEAGAKGYLSKSCEPVILIKAIYALAEGNTYIEKDLQAKISSKQSKETPTESNKSASKLSPREFDVFCLLAEGKSCKEIAGSLFLSEKTVSNYATQIKIKLKARTLSELTKIAYQEGIISI
ncbi:MAG: response regulator transcription factor [Cocleimonas sp.]|nr:response regulator transcription factor [Cocleimonas sp.]